MIVPGSANSLLLRSAGVTAYQVERSLRFNSADSAYLSRTPASAGNRKTWTWSGWVKRSALGATQVIFGTAGSTGNYTTIQFTTDDTLEIYSNSASLYLITSAVFRDASSWAHFVFAVDTTAATSTNRFKLYINGSQVTAFSTQTYPTQNLDTFVNNTIQHTIGVRDLSFYLSGYLADIHFIDGQALDPTSFAETNITTGQWVPKAFSGGSYGTNGFRLAFADNSNNTATTLGKDSSGNGNNWTPNNLSVTAGAGNDSLVDTPTSYGTDTGAGGEVRGNYAVMNALQLRNSAGADSATVSDGNLRVTTASNTGSGVGATIAVNIPGGNFYWEVELISGVTTASAACQIGLAEKGGNDGESGTQFTYDSSNSPTYTNGDIIGCTYNSSTSTLTFYKNNSLAKTITSVSSTFPLFPYIRDNIGGGSVVAVFNFGQRPFAYTAPSGFKALCDTNLAAPVVAKPNTVMDVKLYTGNGSTQAISGLEFSPDFVWIKDRSTNGIDPVLKTSLQTKFLSSNQNLAERGNNDDLITSLDSSGFSVNSTFLGGANPSTNGNTKSFVAYCWDAGSSTVTNTQGSITSSVRANANAGFSIVTYTGNGISSSVGHGLNAVPDFVIVKNRSNAQNWAVGHVKLTNWNWYLKLNLTAAEEGDALVFTSNPTSSVFSIGTRATVNTNNDNYLAYCFAPVAGYSSFGSYTGNGSADGPFVYTGFRPALVIVKMSSSIGNWTVLDYQRKGYNVDNDPLSPNLSDAEGTADLIDLTSNGFKVRTTDATFNTNAGTYVYAAWAQNPYQYARAR